MTPATTTARKGRAASGVTSGTALEKKQRQEIAELRAELEGYRSGIDTICLVAREAASGNREPRSLGIARDGPLGPLVQAINQLKGRPVMVSKTMTERVEEKKEN
mgnify:CR=1 FL=1